jgi:Flp pilus assembly protein TadG
MGQALVEFSLLLPIALFLLLGIYDFSRVYVAQAAVEQAARDAADFGTFNISRWADQTAATSTRAAMVKRACVAVQDLEDYSGDATCLDQYTEATPGANAGSNPRITISLVESDGTTAADACGDVARSGGPCWVRVDAAYDFDIIVPLGFDALDTRFGLPNTLTFTQSSTFAVSSFSLDTDS